MSRKVLTVLRSGGDFEPWHVRAMQRQIQRWAPDAKFACLTDVDVPGVECIPLEHQWPGWWSKLELFRPGLEGDFLFTDLDNVILGPIDDLFTGEYTTQRLGWNALMFVPETVRRHLYQLFRRSPREFIEKWDAPCAGASHGDAGFIHQYLQGAQWEDLLPGQVVNMAELRRPWPFLWRDPPPNTRVVLCATREFRPWKVRMFKHLYEESV